MAEPSAKQILEVVAATRPQGATPPVVAFPTLLVPHARIAQYKHEKLPLAQYVLYWLIAKGLRAERTRMNSYGYVGIFRDLISRPPWVEVEPEDFEGKLTAERAAELSPLYEYVARGLDVTAQFKSYRAEKRSALLKYLGAAQWLPEWLERSLEESFDELTNLARILGPKTTEQLCEAVFEYDPEYGLEEFTTAVGAPDLFVWTPPSLPPFWFFAEVKGPQDHLRASQAAWLANHWQKVQGHFLIISVADVDVVAET